MPLELTGRFQRKYSRLPLFIQLKADKAIEFLEANFRHPGLRSHPVTSIPGIFEAYVDNKYRLTFERRGDTFILRNIDNHDECLRHP
jgi:hypothetical protein